MLGGKIYVGFAFAQQLHGLAVFVFAKLINTVTLRTKSKVIGNHRALTVIEIHYKFVGYLELPSLWSRHNYREETRKGVAVEYVSNAQSA